jgi:hypothetical protein
MTDPGPTVHARAALEGDAQGDDTAPIKVGRLAPYPVWIAVSVVVRASQILCVACIIWYMAALFDAMEKPHRISTPPLWLFIVTAFIGADAESSYRRWRTSPLGDWLGDLLASQQCPDCGQNVFDHTPPSGYEPDSKRHRYFPSRICTNCGHDLINRTASKASAPQ